MTDTHFTSTTVENGEVSRSRLKENVSASDLDVFVGTWRLEGRQYDSPFGQAATIRAEETYSWLPGGLYLIHRFQGLVGRDPMACIEMVGADPSGTAFRVNTFYNDGHSKEWLLRQRSGIWTLVGTWDAGREQTHVCCSLIFDNEGGTRTSIWDRSTDGLAWRTFWEATATRV